MPVFNKMVYNGTEYILWWWGNIWEPLSLKITKSWLNATIRWEDNEIWTIPPTTFQKSELVRKIGSAPTSPSDWDLVVTETVKDTYKTTWYVDQWLTDWETYYYRVFSYSDLGGISYCDAVSITAWVTERPDIDSFSLTDSIGSGAWYNVCGLGVSGDGSYIYIGRDQYYLTQHTATNGELSNYDSTVQSSISYQSRWLWCKPDGSILYDSHDNGDIYQIDMNTPYSLTWATVATNSIWVACCGIGLSYDWTKLYHWVWDNNYAKQFIEYTLATPRDVSSRWTGTTNTVNAIIASSGDESFIYQVSVSPTGKKMYFSADHWKIYQYDLSTAYDWSTATYNGVLDTGINKRITFQFREGGDRLYIWAVQPNWTLYQYDAS